MSWMAKSNIKGLLMFALQQLLVVSSSRRKNLPQARCNEDVVRNSVLGSFAYIDTGRDEQKYLLHHNLRPMGITHLKPVPPQIREVMPLTSVIF
ncbi:hypothetical protein RB195_016519 [Necator americanus]|uniref:Secreted protein n=1 Tax=Necator americanus TaxID=51031 RepID=A0ABR1C0T6_NECAM